MTATAALAVSDLHVEYAGGARAVRGVDLAIAPGACLALVGESGCGKTTIGLAVLGLLPDGTRTDGSIRAAGHDVVGASPRTLRALRGLVTGFVAQSPFDACNPLQRVGAHVAEAWRAHGDRPEPDDVAGAIERLDIEKAARAARRWPHQWSGGMLQRASIAAAAARSPALIVADEPTSALDAECSDATLRALRATGAAILLITHDLGLAATHADEIAVCYAGRIVETGAAAGVLERPRHPHTAALLAALPRPGHGLPVPLAGTPPSPHGEDCGCAFAPRCAHAVAACATGQPPALRDGVRCPLTIG